LKQGKVVETRRLAAKRHPSRVGVAENEDLDEIVRLAILSDAKPSEPSL
jgi:hypothetical protein